MGKIKEPTIEDIEKIDHFNSYMIKAWLFIKDGKWITMSSSRVMKDGMEYTMSQAIKDFTNLYKK